MAAMAHVWAWSVEAAFSCTAGRVPERQIQRLSTDEARGRVLAAGSLSKNPSFAVMKFCCAVHSMDRRTP